MVFVPLPVKTLCGWHKQAGIQIKRMGEALARNARQDKTRHLFQRLDVLLTKGNAELFFNASPATQVLTSMELSNPHNRSHPQFNFPLPSS